MKRIMELYFHFISVYCSIDNWFRERYETVSLFSFNTVSLCGVFLAWCEVFLFSLLVGPDYKNWIWIRTFLAFRVFGSMVYYYFSPYTVKVGIGETYE